LIVTQVELTPASCCILLVLQYIADAGGAAAEEDYQYMGQNMFCG
jgi:hypothetical protein